MNEHKIRKRLTDAYRYSLTRLALNYYTFYEILNEEADLQDENFEVFSGKFHKLLDGFLNGESIETELGDLRDQMTKKMESALAYADCFQIYEYVLNRIERRFFTIPDTKCTDDEFTNRLIEFIRVSGDQNVLNGRLAEIVGQLPIRFTKQKFFDIVREGLSLYHGSPVKDLESVMYMLRSAARTSLDEQTGVDEKKLSDTLDSLKQLDFKTMTKESFKSAFSSLESVSETITGEFGVYQILQELINDLYVLELAKAYVVTDIKEEETSISVVRNVLNCFLSGNACDMDVEKTFSALEGKQELYYERYLNSEAAAEAEEPTELSRLSGKIDLLLSGSEFVSLDEENGSEGMVDKEMLEQTVRQFFEELTETFTSEPRPVVRAVMARVLSTLPVIFQSSEEVREYIKNSLASCTDEAEKEACKELLINSMEEEYALV